jgi:hypothetical protein
MSSLEDTLFQQPVHLSAFQKEVPCHVNEEELAELVENYLFEVGQLMHGLEEVLGI